MVILLVEFGRMASNLKIRFVQRFLTNNSNLDSGVGSYDFIVIFCYAVKVWKLWQNPQKMVKMVSILEFLVKITKKQHNFIENLGFFKILLSYYQ